MERKKKHVAIGALASVVLSVVGVGTALIDGGSWLLTGYVVLLMIGAVCGVTAVLLPLREISKERSKG